MKIEKPPVTSLDLSKYSYNPIQAIKEKAVPVNTNFGISNCDNQIKLN
jgi:hypothetical protein